MAPIQDITIINIPIIIGITATVIPRFLALITVTGIMAAIEAVILLMGMGGIMDMAVIEEGTETAGAMGLAVFAAASIDKNANIPSLFYC